MTTDAAPASDLLAHSVTRNDNIFLRSDDRPPSPPGGVLHFNFIAAPYRQVTTLPMDLPLPWSRERDYVLASTTEHNTMWAGAVGWAISRIASLDWTVSDVAGSERRTERARQLLLQANMGAGWTAFLTQHLTDYLTTDNGAFTEVIWSTLKWRRDEAGRLQPVGRPLGIQHLDSFRCTRLNDNDLMPYREHLAEYWGIRPYEVNSRNFPVVYTDLAGRPHLLWRWQVGAISDMASPRLELRGTGKSAAARAYHAIFKDTAMERYVSEKIVGNQPKEIHLVSGIMQQQFEAAMSSSQDQTRSRNQQQYRGVVVIPGIKPDAGITGYRVPIAEIPDGFNPDTERTNTYNKYAVVLGLPKRDLQPAAAGLNSGQTAVVEAEQADGVGLALWKKWIVHWLNQSVLPATTQFEWTGDSISDQKSRAEVGKLRAETRKVQIESGEITPKQALQLAVDSEDVPPEFLPEDGTPQNVLRDDQKPLEDGEAESVRIEETPAAEQTLRDVLSGLVSEKAESGDQVAEETAEKAEDGIGTPESDPIDAVWSEAVKWARIALERRDL